MGSDSIDTQVQAFFAEPADLLNEVRAILQRIDPAADEAVVESAFHDTVLLFRGCYPGYQAARTGYHDLDHTLGVFLAAARLMHGAVHGGKAIRAENIVLGLLAALFHDTGLIQTAEDREGTGAKYTVGHEQRSIAFMQDYLARRGLYRDHPEDCAHILGCTIVALSTSRIPFRDEQTRLIGHIVGTADLLAQMADRLYLEKLLLLFREFQEAHFGGYQTELDLLKSTESFYRNVSLRRMQRELGGVYNLMRLYFLDRHGVDRDFYQEGIEKNILYLRQVLNESRNNYRHMLRRAGIVDRLEREERERG